MTLCLLRGVCVIARPGAGGLLDVQLGGPGHGRRDDGLARAVASGGGAGLVRGVTVVATRAVQQYSGARSGE